MDVEALAVSKITNMIARCPHLRAFITTNDKTPFTDGYIDLYTGLRQSKADWRGRVPVQVKGRTRGSKTAASQKYPVNRTDLIAYQRDSGVLYIVVAVEPKSGRETPYYALLSPFRIESLMNSVPENQLQVSVPLKKLPNDPKSIESIVQLALRTRDQSMTLGFDPVLFERLQSLTVYTDSGLNLDSPVTLSPAINDYSLVLTTTDGLSVPLNGEIRILPEDYLERNVDMTIRSGDTVYESGTVKRIDDEAIEVVISEGLKLILRTESTKQSATLSLTLERTLAGRLRSIEFYSALLSTGVIEFNGKPWPFLIDTSSMDAKLRRHLKTLHALTELFEHLGVDTQLVDMSQIDEVQSRQLNILYRAFVLNDEITDASAETSRVLQRVGPWNLMFLLIPGSKANSWRFIDPFSAEVRQQFEWSSDDNAEGDRIPVTAYDIVEQEHLGTVLNMRLSAIVGGYEAIADLPTTYTLANHRVLALITAADTSELRKDELLTTAASLNDWLIAEQGIEPHHLINRWQIAWRRGTLSTEQRSEIRLFKRQITRNGPKNGDQLQLACALLLGDDDEVQDLVHLLPPRQLEEIRSWPIWMLQGRRFPNDDTVSS